MPRQHSRWARPAPSGLGQALTLNKVYLTRMLNAPGGFQGHLWLGSKRKAIIWGRSWKRITAIILAMRKLCRHGVINPSCTGYERSITRIMS